MIAIPNIGKPQNCAECPISALNEFGGFVCKLNRNNDKSNCPLMDIVICEECRYYKESEYIKGDMVCKYHIGHTYYTEADRFCYYGDRRSDADRKTEKNM